MKLKGKNAKKLKGDTKKKMQDTLKRMKKVRNTDSINLRAKISAKIENLVSEKEKATTYIENFNKKIIELEEMSLKIEGALVALKEAISDDTDV